VKLIEEGIDGNKVAHYGNQIAYELLGLGYTVLYKKMKSRSDLGTDDFWSPLKDKALYDFRYIVTGLLEGNTTANNKIIALADFNNNNPDNTGRGDCIALCDINPTLTKNESTGQANIIKKITSEANTLTASKYAAFFAPSVTYAMSADEDFGGNTTFPASFHYLACAAKAAENYNEWYAIAGYTRGVSN
jgi:hypothetical protein